MDFPRLVYKSAGLHVAVDNEDELAAALAAGWFATVPEALAGKAAPATRDNAAPTREELKIKADEFGIPYGPRTTNAKLLELITAALADAAEQGDGE